MAVLVSVSVLGSDELLNVPVTRRPWPAVAWVMLPLSVRFTPAVLTWMVDGPARVIFLVEAAVGPV